MEKKSGNFLEQDAARIASSPAGKELMSLLYHQNSKDIEKAKQLAASGDLNAAAQAWQEIPELTPTKEPLCGRWGLMSAKRR